MANQMIALQARGPQLPDPSKLTAQYANMLNMTAQRRTAERQGMQAQQQMDINAAEEARAAALHTPALAEAGAKASAAELKTALEFNAFVYTALSDSDSPQQVAAVASRIASLPQFQSQMYQGTLSDAVAAMPQDPEQFMAWKENTKAKTLTAAQQMEQEYIKQTTGTEERLIGVSKYRRSPATEVPGSRIQVAEGMQYIKDDQGNVRAVPKEKPGSFGVPAPSMGAPGQGNTADVVYGFGKFGSPAKPLSQSTIGEVQDFQRNTLIPNTRGKVGAGPDKGTGAVGTYQLVYGTLKEYAPKVLGPNWRDKPFTADVQEQIAKAIYDDVKGGDLKKTWAGLPSNRPGQYSNVPWDQVRDKIIQVESAGGGNRRTPTPKGATGEPPIVVKGSNTKANEALTAKDAAVARYDETIAVAKRLLTNPGLNSIIGNIQGNIPETALSLYSQDAANALADYNTLLTTAGFQELQAMRDASPTGGALGQVAVEENKMLQKSAFSSSRTQAEAKFRQAVKDYISRLERSRSRVVGAFDRQFGGRVAPAAARTPTTPTSTGDTGRPSLDSFRRK
jgi:hypothetical protein